MTTTRIDGRYTRCAGMNHTDGGEIVLHDACNARVAKREDGKLYDVRVSYSGGSMGERYTCWNSAHRCDPAMVAMVDRERAAQIAAGAIVKGATVRVVRGRKVPIGTTGTVFWMGERYGKMQLGIRDAAGAAHWTAESNVEPAIG